ncbi:acyltransferase family protein [Yersinia kristensenii]|uniref:acyltransferase family protein n=1 Tax=Yersinia kristensenii TaxID=28152 RepID=UPI00119E14B3|nr:acyltransferase [Yersinia kristensenii]
MIEKNNITGITALRGLAASLVLIVHSSSLLGFKHNISPLTTLTNIGVDIFFIISGFIITYAHWDDFGKGGAAITNFFKKRILRIYPMYFLFTILTAIAVYLLPQLFSAMKSSNELLLKSLLFLPSEMTDYSISLLLAVAWTLSFEVLFYIIFSTTLLFNRTVAIRTILLMLIAWAVLAMTITSDNYMISFFASTLPLEFLFGVVLCVAYKKERIHLSVMKNKKIGPAFLILMAAFSLIVFCFIFPIEQRELRGNARFLYFGVPSVFIFMAFLNNAVNETSVSGKLVKLIGNASYVTYLSHFMTIGCIKFVMNRITWLQEINLLITVIISCIVCTLVGITVHKVIEVPIARFLKGRTIFSTQSTC